MKWHRCVSVMATLVLAVTASAVRADISLDIVTVGNAGNATDSHGVRRGGPRLRDRQVRSDGRSVHRVSQRRGGDRYVRAVQHEHVVGTAYGCKIQRSGSSGSYTYSVAADRANRPVNYVSFWDAARFANWLHNGQGNGDTESGAYVNVGNQSTFARQADAKYWIPTENEWYKAAYHKNDGVTGNYFDYPTEQRQRAEQRPDQPGPGQQRELLPERLHDWQSVLHDRGGRVRELGQPLRDVRPGRKCLGMERDAVIGSSRGLRGGSWSTQFRQLAGLLPPAATTRRTRTRLRVGFRVASVPEPGSITLMLCGALAGLLCWYRKRKS